MSDHKLDYDPHAHDIAPGDEHADEASVGHGVRSYLVGLLLAAGLTVASFWLATAHVIWEPAVPVALGVLAIAQMGVHLVYFLHITTGPDNTNNVLALAFGVLMVALVVGGSIWIMGHLALNTLPNDSGGMPPM